VPSSVSFCLRNLEYAISTLSFSGRPSIGDDLREQIHALLPILDAFPLAQTRSGEVERLDAGELEAEFAFSGEEVAEAFSDLAEQVESLHERIEDIFFSHQDIFVQSPTLFDLE